MPGRFFNVECFAGRSEIAKAFKRGGYPAAALDLKLNPDDAPCSHLKYTVGVHSLSESSLPCSTGYQ